MGLFSTCQFLGAFSGGAAGGWLLQHWGGAAVIAVCLVLGAIWLLLSRPDSVTNPAPAAATVE